MEKCGILRRIIASVYDGAFALLLVEIVLYFSLDDPRLAATMPGIGEIPRSLSVEAGLLLGAIALLFPLMEVLYAASPGKVLARQRIRAAHGGQASFLMLLARATWKHALLVGVGLMLVTNWPYFALFGLVLDILMYPGFLLVLLPSKRSLYDYLSGTAVFTLPPDPKMKEVPTLGFLGHAATIAAFVIAIGIVEYGGQLKEGRIGKLRGAEGNKVTELTSVSSRPRPPTTLSDIEKLLERTESLP